MNLPPDLAQRVLALAIQIQQIPAPTFQEKKRADFIFDQFVSIGLEASRDSVGNVYTRFSGSNRPDNPAKKRPILVLSAHLDTVFPEGTPLDLVITPDKVTGPGIGDNALGLACLFGLVWGLRHQGIPFPGEIWLVADVNEEGLGNMRGMEAVLARFASLPVQAYMVLEGLGLGQLSHRGLEVQRYRIGIETAGGHSWTDSGQPSAIHELNALASRLLALPLQLNPRTILNIGVFTGGTSVNSIAAHASLELDLRSERHAAVQALASHVATLARAARRPGVQVTLEEIGRRPAGEIPASHPLVQTARQILTGLGIQPAPGIGSTDANLPLSRGLPAICLGMTTGGRAHSPGEFINTQPLQLGLAQLVQVVSALLKQPGS